MKMTGNRRTGIIWAIAVAGLCLGGSFLVAIKLMGNIYYAEWLTASSLAVLVLIAWLSYLRDDRLMKRGTDHVTVQEKDVASVSSARARRVMLLAAALLGLASAVMYFFFGIGAALTPR